ncbi:MAG: hypothetical protein M0R17_13390 [Candidatus Omnitrophica bacterium]|jgi:hypothetical protein|nr:hypothetical protein [Candidatus Omnitrophota bacterium]
MPNLNDYVEQYILFNKEDFSENRITKLRNKIFCLGDANEIFALISNDLNDGWKPDFKSKNFLNWGHLIYFDANGNITVGGFYWSLYYASGGANRPIGEYLFFKTKILAEICIAICGIDFLNIIYNRKNSVKKTYEIIKKELTTEERYEMYIALRVGFDESKNDGSGQTLSGKRTMDSFLVRKRINDFTGEDGVHYATHWLDEEGIPRYIETIKLL